MPGRRQKRLLREAPALGGVVGRRPLQEASCSSPRRSSEAFYSARDGPPPLRLGAAYFDQPCTRLARALLGQVLVRKLPDGKELRGRIVETEAYLGGDDSASHSRGGRQTARNTAMFMMPGTLYVYQIYGIYFCMNVSSQGEGAAVLLRSLEPLQGLDAMRELRLAQRKGVTRPPKDWQLCNGPSKLCQALAIDKSFDQQDLASHPTVWLESSPGLPREEALICAPRVGISGEWAQKPLRFYILGNKCVSIRDKVAEGPAGAGLLHVPAEASSC
ncbi:DNA-3-methyladenine glycosylase [Rhineura floridana]|uniref:DNA-3-methyladenine glycosylase n=1 Tax=Rhineura floridana TaxID=261503 RepID=UPI002AC83FFF|nr:DNA-3-methyladenine glycosylase [Rhineura floridana]